MNLSKGNRCDICGKPRGNSGIDHTECSKARKAKGDLKDRDRKSVYAARAKSYLKGTYKFMKEE